MHLETAANLCASQHQENDIFADMAAKPFVCSVFELGGITKHLMTGPTGNSLFPLVKCLNQAYSFRLFCILAHISVIYNYAH